MNNISLIDLKPQIDSLPYPIPNILLLLANCPIPPQTYKDIIFDYKISSSSELLGIKSDNEFVGVIGLEVLHNTGIIKHFMILPQYQYQGIGTKIIKTLPIKYGFSSLHAEADNETVNFYTKLGFMVLKVEDTSCPNPKYNCTLNI
ncbi:GNAT family N-acetyltransferase [Candidatus Jidaibacter acanthamoebae]|nr:GNAT family N-acetyltransferase [Candidatus Jidaibacter acanthamoeba]MBA8667974.1 GNAT family N-acetyltransferase [Holosporaceae bacterium 'Namur']